MAGEARFVTMMWGPRTSGKADSEYTAAHVNKIHNMLEGTQKNRFRLICVGDSMEALHHDVDFIEIPKAVRGMIRKHGGNFAKLYLFSKEFREKINCGFIYLDLDVIIVDDLSYLFDLDQGMLILEGSRYEKVIKFADPDRYTVGRSLKGLADAVRFRGILSSLPYLKYSGLKWCKFNSSIVLVSREDFDIWDGFDPVRAKKEIAAAKLIGTDQAWLHLKYPGKYKVLTRSDGFWRHKALKSFISREQRLPECIKFVAFPGADEKPWMLRGDEKLKSIMAKYPE